MVTHFVPCRSEADAWLPVTFYTQCSEKEGYFCGTDIMRSYSKEEMAQLVSCRAVERLPVQVILENDELVWISPSYEIWVADKHDPIHDKDRKLAKEGK